MWPQMIFKSRTAPPTRPRPLVRRPPAARPRLEALEGRRLPSFTPAGSYPTAGAPDAVLGDFNGDARPDIAVTNHTGMAVRVLSGRGDGTFQDPVGPAPTTGYSGAMAVADFDGDGKLDLVTTTLNAGNGMDVGLRPGNGDGTFGPAQLIWTTPVGGWSVDSVAAGDLNGDGLTDLVIDSYGFIGYAEEADSSSAFGILLGRGDGTFTTSGGVGGEATTSALADMNGDGRPDVVTGSNRLAVLGVGLGNGDGTFSPGGVTGTWDIPASVAPGDFNRDGHLDVATPNTVLLGNGDGTFRPPLPLPAGSIPGNVVVADFDRDGIPDLAVASAGYSDESLATHDSFVRVFLGNGDGTFRMQEVYPASLGARVVAAQDLNGDGFPDLVVGRFTLDELTVLLNGADWPATPPPPVHINDVTLVEGNGATRNALFTVSLAHAFGRPVTVTYGTANGTAGAGSDYRAAFGTLTFAPGETRKKVTVRVNGDRLAEPDETFLVYLGNPTNATIADGLGVGTILDDEPRIRISDVTRAEGGKGATTRFTFTVTLSAAYDRPVTVSVRTADGTAHATDHDYAARARTLTFLPGQTSRRITVAVVGDGRLEEDETFFVDLTGPTDRVWFTKKRGVGTILNDD